MRIVLAALALLTSCHSFPLYSPPEPASRTAIYFGAGMAGKNNPVDPSGDEDNLTIAVGVKMPWRGIAIRPEIHAGDHTWQATPSVTYEFPIAGKGPGSIDGHIGVGYSLNGNDRNSILGNSDAAFLAAGAEAYLVGDLIVGARLMVAPRGYNHEHTAVASVVYFGIRL